MRKDVGLFSKAMTESIKRAEAMQATACLALREAYGVEDRKMMDIEGLTWAKFNEVLDGADRGGMRDQLEQELREMMADALIMVLSQPEQQA